MPCILVDSYQWFGVVCWFCLGGRRRQLSREKKCIMYRRGMLVWGPNPQLVSQKSLLCKRLHDVTFQKTTVLIFHMSCAVSSLILSLKFLLQLGRFLQIPHCSSWDWHTLCCNAFFCKHGDEPLGFVVWELSSLTKKLLVSEEGLYPMDLVS